ncbi:cytochrome b561 [Gellertiella hungarica]|uniref:Cytochrome b561 n=1 Tax=Gellertiella hungarica TaxID=1572859 RepID=A0A7W6NL53_9HYPH|nr:cytochrome b/b6 domain-containing protein [Gellertiella hungarica]MBB4065214.1 cytochrome b561 [Gellertiella hungarica]
MALLIFFNLIVSDGIEEWDRAMDNGSVTPEQIASANIHAYVGFAILGLALVRLLLRLLQGAPDAPPEEPPAFQRAAKLAHGAFYLLFFAMPVLGALKYYADVDVAGFLHAGPVKLVLWILIVVHIAAVPVHRILWKSNIMPRMTTGR